MSTLTMAAWNNVRLLDREKPGLFAPQYANAEVEMWGLESALVLPPGQFATDKCVLSAV